MMMKCWSAHADSRPSFSEIVQSISGFTETLAGYLDMNTNPFISETEQMNNLAPPNRLSALYYNIASKLTGKSPVAKRRSPKGSPKCSPKSSPRVSPIVTPRLTPRVSPQPDPVVNTYTLPPSITIETMD